MRTSIELPPIHLPNADVTSEPLPSLNSHSSRSAAGRDILPSILGSSPPGSGRSSTLPPLQRMSSSGGTRPRKHSVTKRSQLNSNHYGSGHGSGHRKQRSRGSAADWLRRVDADRLRPGNETRKALSAEPSDYGKRWEDLIDAAASATEDIDDERTPVCVILLPLP